MNNKLFVGNLPFSTKEEELSTLFSQAGVVASVRIITDKMTGRSRGFGFVEMSSEAEALKAIELLNETQMEGRPIHVALAQAKEA